MPLINVKNILNANIMQYIEKPWVKFPVNMNFAGDLAVTAENKASGMLRADLGSVAIKLNNIFSSEIAADMDFAEKTFKNVKGVARCSARAKSAGGILNKLEKGVKKGKINDLDSAKAWITDGKGLRIELEAMKKLDAAAIDKMISGMKIEGKELTANEASLLKKYIYSEYEMTAEEINQAFPIFEKFINPLIEKHSQPVYDEIMLSIIKNRMIKDGLTIIQIREEGLLSEKLINKLMTKDIIPREYEVLNNYRGEYGIPVFTNRQVQMMRKASSGKLIVHSRPDMLEYSRHPHAEINRSDMGIKESGYQGAQFKVANNAEEQYRGLYASMGAEEEHASYDAVLEKFTSAVSEKHVKALKKLTDEEKAIYDKYKARYFNAWARRDLGLPYSFPELPANFDENLSMDSIKKIHKIYTRLEKANENFVPHFIGVA